MGMFTPDLEAARRLAALGRVTEARAALEEELARAERPRC
jgi:hypothetical protein